MMRNGPVQVSIELGRSRIDGVGVFAVRPFKAGEKIADGLSHADFKDLVSWKHFKNYDAAVRKKIRDFCIGTTKGFVAPEGFDFNKLSVEWFLNHSCDGNVGFNDDGDFSAIKTIKRGTELTYDYGIAESNPRFKLRCKCGTKVCRGRITGNDWKRQEFCEKNLRVMLPELRNQILKGRSAYVFPS